MKYQSLCQLILASLFLISCHPHMEKEERIIGVKIYAHPGALDDLFKQWEALGINTAFSSLDLLSREDYRAMASEHHVSTYVIFPVFFNPDALAVSPGLYAITSEGEPAKEEWVEFVCPAREDYRRQVVEKARDIIRKYDPDGISIDFIRHFVFWEKVYPDRDPATLPVTCFDSICIAKFSSMQGVVIPEGLKSPGEKASWILENHHAAWTAWKCSLITSMVEEIADAARKLKPGIGINVHLVPWGRTDYDGAGRSVAGQDIPALARLADYLSPMTYAHMVKRDPEWIHGVVEDINRQSGGRVLPSIQVNKAYLDTELDPEEFRRSLRAALEPPSNGVILWSWEQLAEYPEKLTVLHDILHGE